MLDDETNRMIEEALEGRPRASVLTSMVEALVGRREMMARDLAEDPDRSELPGKIKALDQQIQTLREELAITEFVENSVRSAARRPRPVIDDDEWFG